AKLKKIEASGGPVLSLADAGLGKGGTWNNDGVILFSAGFESPIFRVSADGGRPDAVTTVASGSGEQGHCEPRFLPDGRRFLFVARMKRGSYANGHRLMIGSLSGGEPREIMRTFSQAEAALGRLWFVREGTLLACPFDAETAEITGAAVPVAGGAVFSGWAAWNALGYFSVSPTGVIAYHTGSAVPKSILTWYDRDGTELSTVGSPEYQYHISISPDRSRAAVQLEDIENVTWGLWIYDLARGLKELFTSGPSAGAQPVWSPDGTRIAFGSLRTGSLDTYIKPVAGGNGKLVAVETSAGFDSTNFDTDWPLDWSPDGRYLVYCDVDAGGNADLWALPIASGGPPVPIRHSPFAEEDAAISPDGEWLAYISDESGRFEIYVTDFPSGARRWQVSAGGGIRPEWSPVGDELFFLAPGDTLMSARVTSNGGDFHVGEVRALFPVDVRLYVRGEPGQYAVGPGAEEFLVNRILDTGTTSPIRLIVGWSGRR
ncbi:MAG: hypothetical protein P8181_16275, partial [bacterium]